MMNTGQGEGQGVFPASEGEKAQAVALNSIAHSLFALAQIQFDELLANGTTPELETRAAIEQATAAASHLPKMPRKLAARKAPSAP